MKIINGRDFSKEMIADSKNAIIVNEALVNILQLENPLKTEFVWGEGGSDEKKGTIIGVAENFQYMSLKSDINPVVIQIRPSNSRIFAIRILPENIDETIKYIKDKWETLDPSHPFEYYFHCLILLFIWIATLMCKPDAELMRDVLSYSTGGN